MISIPSTTEGVRDALITHISENDSQFRVVDEKHEALDKSVSDLLKGKTKMAAETINVGSGMDGTAAMMAMLGSKSQDGLGGGGLLTGVLLASLLRGNGLLGGAGEAVPAQSQANMSLMQGIGDVKAAVAVSTAQMETSQALQSSTIQGQISAGVGAINGSVAGVKDAVNSNTVVLMQQLNGIEKSIMENRYELGKDITTDGDKTRALIVQQYEATLNRQLAEANAALIELRSQNAVTAATRGIEVTTTNNINQLQTQQQQQQQLNGIAALVSNLANDLQYIRATNQAINVGSGVLTASPTNTNTNIR